MPSAPDMILKQKDTGAQKIGAAFRERMCLEEALEVMAGRGPRAILEVSENAGPADIQKAYRKLARQYHPDRILETGYTEQFARAKFQEIQAAYVILGGK